MQFEISSFVKLHIKVLPKVFCIFKFDLDVKHCSYLSNKNHGLQKKTLEKKAFFAVDYIKILHYIVHRWRHIQSE